MCAAKLVTMPTVEEMGKIIRENRSGALKGLATLHYLQCKIEKVKNASKDQVCAAFSRFFADVSDDLSIEEKTQMSWNTITAEHSLCKLTRMVRKGHYL